MAMNAPVQRYTLPARALHGLTVMAMLTVFALALGMDGMPLSPRKLHLINYHKWAGVTVLALAILRVVWRIYRRPPPLPAETPRHEVGIAHATHALLYLLMFSVPLLGWAYSSAKGFPVVWFGVLPLPALLAPNPELAETLKWIHERMAWGLGGLIVLHVAAALKHRFIDRDTIMQRMI
ncbi:cytochrome b [Burkholderiaceae bacterium DAT-1]|nr:cytochrome b [Burkholderiaceae bacterium DAT-1]